MTIPCKIKPELSDGSVEIEHEGKWVTLKVDEHPISLVASLSPAEAKALAAALVHYAERAQDERKSTVPTSQQLAQLKSTMKARRETVCAEDKAAIEAMPLNPENSPAVEANQLP